MLPRRVGGIVGTLRRTTGSRNIRGRIGGEPVVAWLALVTVAFVLVTAGVIVLARSSTARWEQAKRASVVPRRDGVDAPGRPGGSAAWLAGAVVRRVAAGRRGQASPRASGSAVTGGRGRLVALLGSPVRSLRSLFRGVVSWPPLNVLRRSRAAEDHGTASPLDDGPPAAAPPAQDDAGADPAAGGHDVAGHGSRLSLRRISRRGRRRAPRFWHRQERVGDRHTVDTERDESSSAR